MKSKVYQEAFINLANVSEDVMDTDIFATLEKFVCQMYKIKNCDDTNSGRFELFMKNFTAENIDEPFENRVIKFDACHLPPCQAELYQHVLRTKYIARIWRNAHLDLPTILSPEDNGWLLNNDQYEFHWFEGDQLPPTVSDAIANDNIDIEANYANIDCECIFL